MKKSCFALTIASLALAGCTATTITTPWPAGRMNLAGDIQPCYSDRRDAQACGNAMFNATVIDGIEKGQTRVAVREIMRHDAERREVLGDTESWGYLTNYEAKMMTWITFDDVNVTSLSHEVVAED